MKAKRLVSFVATSAMLMSMAAPALAVTADALGRLQGLGVVTGYTAGGSDFKPDQTITRAEFAAVAVRLLGLDDAAAAAKGSTKFKDVSASHWASGYINLAVGNGVIKGYPNGTFKPEGQVTYAEAFAMLVRVLGYEPQVTGSWPTNYVGKASQIGLMDGLSTTDFNAAALRGNIFTAADNALDIDIMEQTVFGTDPAWEVQDKTLLEDKLDYVKAKDITITNIPITTTSLDSNEVTLSGEYDGKDIGGNYEVVGAFDATANLGLKGTAWINRTDDKIVLFQSDDKVEQDQIKTKNAGTGVVELKVKDDTYNVTADTKVYVNYKSTANSSTSTVADKVNALAAGEMVNVVLDGDDIQAIYAFTLSTDIVDRVDTSNDKIYVTEGGGTLTLADNYTIVKDGKTIALSDVKAGDVVQWAKDGSDTYYVRVSSNTATGKVSSITSTTTYTNGGTSDETYKVTVGGTQYTTAIDAQYSTDKGDTYDTIGNIDDLSDVDGQDVTAYLDSFGKVAFIKAGDGTEGTSDTVLLKEFTQSNDRDGSNYYVRVMKADGTEATYKMDDDTTADIWNGTKLVNEDLKDDASNTDTTPSDGITGYYYYSKEGGTAQDLKPGMLVKLDLNADGTTVDNIENYKDGIELKTGDPAADNAVTSNNYKSDDNNTIKVAGKTLQVQSDTKFFTVDTYDLAQGAPAIKDAKFVTWADVKSTYEDDFSYVDAGVKKYVGVTAVFDGAKAQYVFIGSNKDVTSDTLVGILDTKGTSGGDKVLNMVMPDGNKTVECNWTSTYPGADDVLYTFELDTDNEASSVAAAVAREVYTGPVRTARTYEVKDITAGLDNTKIITLSIWDKDSDTVGTDEYDVIVKDSQTTYFDVTDDPIKVDGVSKGDHVTIYDLLDKDGNYDFADYNNDGVINSADGLYETDGIVDYVVIDN